MSDVRCLNLSHWTIAVRLATMPDMIALIAHDQKKRTLVEFVRGHIEFFRAARLVATNSTGTLLHSELGLNIERVASGPQGGDLIIGGRVAEGLIQAVIFFRDPLTAQPHEPDVSALMRVCDVHNVPLATNRATAESVVRTLALASRTKRQPPKARRKSSS